MNLLLCGSFVFLCLIHFVVSATFFDDFKSSDSFVSSSEIAVTIPDDRLFLAARGNDIEAVRSLISQHVNVNSLYDSKLKISPLMVASWNSFAGIVTELLSCEDIDVNAQNGTGQTALHHAVLVADLKTISLLLAHPRIDVNLSDDNLVTVLHLATSRGEADIIKLLLKFKELNIEALNSKGQTPLMCAMPVIRHEIEALFRINALKRQE